MPAPRVRLSHPVHRVSRIITLLGKTDSAVFVRDLLNTQFYLSSTATNLSERLELNFGAALHYGSYRGEAVIW